MPHQVEIASDSHIVMPHWVLSFKTVILKERDGLRYIFLSLLPPFCFPCLWNMLSLRYSCYCSTIHSLLTPGFSFHMLWSIISTLCQMFAGLLLLLMLVHANCLLTESGRTYTIWNSPFLSSGCSQGESSRWITSHPQCRGGHALDQDQEKYRAFVAFLAKPKW